MKIESSRILDRIAKIEVESPQWKKVVFLAEKERPKEAPFLA
jgi:hypothetical protein